MSSAKEIVDNWAEDALNEVDEIDRVNLVNCIDAHTRAAVIEELRALVPKTCFRCRFKAEGEAGPHAVRNCDAGHIRRRIAELEKPP